MKERRRGRIINVASFVGVLGMPRRVAYGTAKAALIGLTRMLAMEVAPFGVTVNAARPGPCELR